MNDLQIFRSEDFGNIRTAEIEGKIFFCGSDVAKALGYSRPNEAVTRHAKGTLKRRILTNGGEQEMLLISEGDVYRLITHSKLPTAYKFERWVFDEVLPSIRRHGAYMTEKTLEEAILNPDYLLKLAQTLKDETDKRKALESKTKVQEQIIMELKPRADYTDRILHNKGLVTITQIAKDYGMSGQAMNALLNNLCIQYKSASGQWLLYAKYQDKGYTHSKTIDIVRSDGRSDIVMETKWTQKGRLFLYEKLKTAGLLPMIEREA